MHVVVTAGHVDHGKSTLVHALTGMQPDRLEEERRRGLSVELGYCWTTLPRAGELVLVDVPGHERFLPTALAGLGPASVVLLVVAADDGWMPQAAEHLAALDALGVRRGLLVVTRCGLADPAPALAAARQAVDATTLRGIPAVRVDSVTGQGLGELRERLDDVLAADAEDPGDAPTRVWVDRAFHVAGTGTVVTGTLQRGHVARGQALEGVGGEGTPAYRVRRLESLGRERDACVAPARVAFSLAGPAPAPRRGDALVSPHSHVVTTSVDVAVPVDVALPAELHLHLGSARRTARVRPLAPGATRLRLDAPLPLHVGDRGVLRDPGDRTLLGVRVLDPEPLPLARRGDAARHGAALLAGDGTWGSQVRLHGLVHAEDLVRRGVARGPVPAGTVCSGGWLLSPDHADDLAARLRRRVLAHPPTEAPLTTAALAQDLGLPVPGLVAALVGPPLRHRRGTVLAGPAVPPGAEALLDRLREEWDGRCFAAPTVDRLAELGLDDGTAALLHRESLLLRLPGGVLLPAEAADVARAELAMLPAPFTVSAARMRLGTTRRVVLPLLAHLDATGATLRLPDDRRRLR